MAKNPKLFLIDGNSLAYRAFYALPDTMKNSAGLTTNAIYGFTTMLLKIIEEKPDYLAISFDLPEPTFRHKEYKEYKAKRAAAPPTLNEQRPYFREIAAAFGIPIYEMPGFEADDVIGTLAVKGEKAGLEVVIVTGDLDPLQLVDQKIKVLSTRKGITDTILYGEKEVAERYGIKPDQLIDFKALKGDTSDNVPGVPKVGEKTAAELIKRFGDLDNIYNNLDQITQKALKENLKNNLPLAQLSKRLVTIVTDLPLEIDLKKMAFSGPNWHNVLPLFEIFEFNSLVKKYSQGLAEYQAENIVEKKRAGIARFNFQCVRDNTALEKMIARLEKSGAFAFDLETTGLDPWTDQIVGISFSCERECAYYVPIGRQVPASAFSSLFQSKQLKIGHNLKFDLAMLKNSGIDVAGPFFDTMVAAYLLDPTSGKYSLKHLAKQLLGREMIELMELIGPKAQCKNFAEVPIEVATDYAASDAEATFGLYEIFKLALKAQKMDKLFHEIEMPLIEVLVEMEHNGIAIDQNKLAVMSQELDRSLKELEKQITILAGEEFNINSPKQLAKILFEKLQLPVTKRTKTGPSTDAEVLEELAAHKYEIAERLLDFRTLTKLKNTYIDVLPTLINPKTGRLHTSFNQTITATGRLSSSEPNLQNIPARGEWGKRIRAAFVPDKKDQVIIAADYSQVELRILASMSNDPELIKAFEKGEDVHQATADELGISRAAAKTINFGIIYGMSDFGLAKSLGIKKQQAAEYIEKYFKRHAGVKAFMDQTIKEAKERGYVTTLFGRKRPMPDINSPNHGLRSFAERSAINTPIQGTAADMIKLAMVNIYRKLQTTNYKLQMILQVHDELVFECPADQAKELAALVKEEMEQALPLTVPVEVEVKAGVNWAEAK